MASNFVFSILWIALLVFLAWPIAGFCGGIWILLQPFEACFGFIKGITSFLEKLITWPRDVGHAISTGSTSFPAPM